MTKACRFCLQAFAVSPWEGHSGAGSREFPWAERGIECAGILLSLQFVQANVAAVQVGLGGSLGLVGGAQFLDARSNSPLRHEAWDVAPDLLKAHPVRTGVLATGPERDV